MSRSAVLEGEDTERRRVRVGILPVGFASHDANITIGAMKDQHACLIAWIRLWQRRIGPFRQTAFAVVAKHGKPTIRPTAHEQVVESFAVHISPADPGTECTELARQQRLPNEIVEWP